MKSHNVTKRLQDLYFVYKKELLERIIPFWVENAIDFEKGGILSCISDEGKILSRDRYMWSQLRAVWTFSALYNNIAKNHEWLDIAWNIYHFSKKYGRDAEGRWNFSVSQEGRVLEGTTSIFTDAFAVYGFVELARASGEKEPLQIALETYEVAKKYLQKPGSYKTAPYPLPEGMKSHAVAMLYALTWFELGKITNNSHILYRAEEYARQVMEEFLRPEYGLVFEYVSSDGNIITTPQGFSVVPGHAIESMWFIIKIAEHLGKKKWIERSIDTIRKHLEFGWDEKYSGLLLSRDARDSTPWWPWADSKLWWPHTESIIALLYAYSHCKQNWSITWLERIHSYAWKNFRRRGLQEWIQKLDRKGNILHQTVALPVKDPFHLPRALIYGCTLLEQLVNIR